MEEKKVIKNSDVKESIGGLWKESLIYGKKSLNIITPTHPELKG